jgi:hypothetical protein
VISGVRATSASGMPLTVKNNLQPAHLNTITHVDPKETIVRTPRCRKNVTHVKQITPIHFDKGWLAVCLPASGKSSVKDAGIT